MAPGVLSLFLIAIFLPLSHAWTHPNVFVPVSGATCQSGYAWMNNAEQKDPCHVVAYVLAPCAGNTWTQSALPSGMHYNPPPVSMATPCYCSQSCYNLLMACTLCQGPAYTDSLVTWPSFITNCSSSYTDKVFPQGYALFNNTSIPNWATTDPATWPAKTFDIEQAQNYHNQNPGDTYFSNSNSSASSSSSSGSSDIGPIVGGAVGGAIGVLLILLGGYFLCRRRRYRHPPSSNGVMVPLYMPMASNHTRWPSDPSTVTSSGLTVSSSPTAYADAQPQGMGTNALSPTSYSSFQIPSAPADNASFVTTGHPTSRRVRPIPIV